MGVIHSLQISLQETVFCTLIPPAENHRARFVNIRDPSGVFSPQVWGLELPPGVYFSLSGSMNISNKYINLSFLYVQSRVVSGSETEQELKKKQTTNVL